MTAIIKILAALVSVLGVLSAFKTLIPEDITYSQIVESTVFISGWGVSFILCLVLIYQEIRHRDEKQTQAERQDVINNLLNERANDKEYLQNELSKSNISLNHLTSGLNRFERPIPRTQRSEDQDEF
ncbi:hypothetical protein [Vibrio metschnikovii]|uniref:hypothetical protein n=1 Tax=Vibrio metschnikovii TaxID=28172 RepID=UPI002FC5F1B5